MATWSVMKAEQESREIQQLLAACEAGTRHGRAVRDRVGAWVRARRGEGATQTALAAELGLSTQTLRRWEAEAPAVVDVSPRHSKLRAVTVVDDAATVSVVSPSGYRVDGLSLRDAAALLRELS